MIPNLFIGSIYSSYNTDCLKRLGITHIVNISNVNSIYTHDFVLLTIHFRDKESYNLFSVIPIAHLFINKALQDGKCLVHW